MAKTGNTIIIEDQNNIPIWPVTHERAVRDSSGVNLETKLQDLQSTDVQLEGEIGQLADINDELNTIDEVLPEGNEIVSQYIVMPGSSVVRQFLEVPLSKGNTYHFKIVPNGYVVGAGNYSFVVNVYSDYDAQTSVATPLSMSKTDYTPGETIEFDYEALVDSKVIRYYIAIASTAGTGVEFTITKRGRDALVSPEVISSYEKVALPFVLEQGSLLSSGEKDMSAISTTRVRTQALIKVYGKTRISIASGLLYSYALYTSDSFSSRRSDGGPSGESYKSTDTIVDWRGYIGIVIRRSNSAALLPHEVSLSVESYSLAEQISEKRSEKSVINYGAVGDGTTDDTSAITAALAEGGVVAFPAGTYLVTAPIPIYSNTEIVMEPGATILRGAEIKALFYTAYDESTTGYDGVHDVTIRGGVLDMGTGISQGGFPLGLNHCKDIKVHDVTFRRSNVGYHCIDCCGVKDLEVRGCTFKDILSNSIYAEIVQIDNALAYSHFPILDLNGTYDCWDGTVCENVEICGCRFELNDYSPAVGNHNAGAHKFIDIHDNVIIGNGSAVNTRGAIAFGESSLTPGNHTNFVNVHDNTIQDCAVGFQIASDGLVVVQNNIFVNIVKLKTEGSAGTFANNYTIS